MTLVQLGERLNDMYFNCENREASAMIHLFGIKYAKEIESSGEPRKAIALASGIPESYGSEISKGVKLAKYVSLKS